jgi:hypothetical protein
MATPFDTPIDTHYTMHANEVAQRIERWRNGNADDTWFSEATTANRTLDARAVQQPAQRRTQDREMTKAHVLP